MNTLHSCFIRIGRSNPGHEPSSKAGRWFLGLMCSMALALPANAGTATWDAGGASPAAPADGAGIWDPSVANWSNGSGDSGWNSGDNAVIGANNGAAGIISITNTAGVTAGNITYNAAGSGSYNVNGAGTLILAGNPTLTVANGVIATNAVVLGGTGFTKAGNGRLVLQPPAINTNSGAVNINAGTLQLASTSVTALNGDVFVNPGATLLISASVGMVTNKTLAISGGVVTNLGTSGNSTETHGRIILDNNGAIACAGTVIGQLNVSNLDLRSGLLAFPKFPSTMITNSTVKSTPGTAIIQSRANSSGVNGIFLTLNAGTMISDYPNPAPNGDSTGGAKFINNANVPLTLGGGTLFFRFNALANRTEVVGSTLVVPGATSLLMTNGSAANNFALTMNAISRRTGGTLDIAKAALGTGTANFTTTSANVSGILGGGITWAGSDWAVGATLAPYTSYQSSTDPTAWASTDNVRLSGNPLSNIPDLTTINSLKLNGAATLTLNGSLTLSSGGLLATATGANAITGGTLLGAGGADLIIQQFSTGDLTLSSTLADNGPATSLTKAGPGKLIISGTDTLTGTNYLNGGTVEVSDLAQLASGPLVMNNGALRYTGSDASSSRSIILNGAGAVLDIAGSATVTQTVPIIGSGGVNSPLDGVNMGDWGGLTKIGSGTLVLAANNIYNGPTIVSNGVLSVNGTNSLTGTSGKTNYLGGGIFTIYGGTLGGTGLISGPVTVKSGGTISPGDSPGTLTLATNLSLETGSSALFEVANPPGASDLLVVQGNLSISNGSAISLSILGSPLAAGSYTLIQYSGTKTGSFNATPVIVGGSIDGSYVIDDSTPGQINLIVNHAVVITSQPGNTNLVPGGAFSVSVAATGTAPITYQWYVTSDTNLPASAISGATDSTYFLSPAFETNSGYYSVVVTNNYSSVTSLVAFVKVAATAPTLSGPSDQTVVMGNNAVLTATLTSGAPAPSYQWYFGAALLSDNAHISGSGTLSLTVNNVQYPADQGTYSIVASNSAGSYTNSAFLTIYVPPAITNQPAPVTVNAGNSASFTAGASGVPAPTGQWYKNNALLPGQTGNTLTIATAQGSDIALYSFVASNAAGSATSSVVKLTVVSTTLAQTSLSPSNGAAGVCYDTPLYISFNSPVTNVNSGVIRIYNSASPGTPVDTLDMSSNNASGLQPHSLFPGDSQTFNYYPVILNGTTAAIYPHEGVLTSNQTYYVVMDSGIFADSSGAYFAGISSPGAWQFTTKPAGPANPTNIIVAADGTGDFVTVQGAVDSIPLNNTAYTVINIQNGNYVEIVDISSKNHVTFRGQSRTGAVVGYPNNNNINGSTHNRMAFKVNADDVAIENMTVANTTPQGGSQAEALMIETAASHFILNNAEVDSRQDTVLGNVNSSQGYFYNSLIQGNFDYVWGGGNLFFTNCEIRTIAGTATPNLAAPRTDNGLTGNWPGYAGLLVSNGISFVNCQLTRVSGVTNCLMSDHNGSQNGLVAYIGCSIDMACYTNADSTAQTSQLLWESGCSNLNNTLALDNTASPFIGFTQLNSGDPRLLAAENAVTWLNSWMPQLAPNILSQPTNQTTPFGQAVTLAVSATGVPDPTYQWIKNGTNTLADATNASYTIPSASIADTGTYTVVVTTPAGSVTSSAATLTVNPADQTITFPSPGDQTYGVAPITLTATASSGLPVTYSVTSGPASVAGSTLTISGAGSVDIQASQSGDADWNPAAPVSVTISVSPAPLTITANSRGKTFGLALTFAGTEFVPAGLFGADSVDSVTLSSAGAAAAAAPGSYDIVPGAAVGSGLANYTINYVNGTLLVIAPPQLSSAALSSGQLRFTFQSAAGDTYQLEYKDDLSAPSWTPIGGPISGTGNLISVTNTAASQQQFFRLNIMP